MIESDAGYDWLSGHIGLATALSRDDHVYKMENPGGVWPVIVATPGVLHNVSWDGGRTSALQRQEWNVVVIDKGNDDTRASRLAEAIYQRLRFRVNEFVAAYGCTVLSCLAGDELDYSDRDADGNIYRHRGNLYTLLVHRN